MKAQERHGHIATVRLLGDENLAQQAATVSVKQAAIVLIDPSNIVFIKNQRIRRAFKSKAPVPVLIDIELALGEDVAARGIFPDLFQIAINSLDILIMGIAKPSLDLTRIEPLAPFQVHERIDLRIDLRADDQVLGWRYDQQIGLFIAKASAP